MRQAMSDAHTERIQAICEYITQHSDQTITLASLSQQFGLSPHYLQRVFKAVTGVTPRQYADSCRMGHFKARLRGGAPVTDALFDAGFSSSSRLYERTSTHLGMTPSDYTAGGPGIDIRYTVTRSSLGMLLVAATEQGLCAVKMGEDRAEVEAMLSEEFPAASIHEDADALAAWLEQILDYLDGKTPDFRLPMAIRATAFQRRVWEELQRIPYGETRSYQQIAAAIGQPKASRAVGQACGANPVPLVIPCHRVIRSDGRITGYRYGSERKRWLLSMEQGSDNA